MKFHASSACLGIPTVAMLAAFAPEIAAAQPPAMEVRAPADSTEADLASGGLETAMVTARRRTEDAQSVPVSLSVVDAATLEVTRANNTADLSQLVPSLNYVSPNPRNTAFTIRGLGSSVLAIAQSNDGLEPGVGFYVDQVYHGRPATAAFDFVDLERVEVLRGPQGTLFGKNTTAGTINLSSQAPSFQSTAVAEVSAGDYGYFQAKGAFTGPLAGDVLAGRVSAASTVRGGVLDNVTVGGADNDIRNAAVRAQVLYVPAPTFQLRVIADYSSFDNHCCTQVFFGVGTTLKPAARQFPALAAGMGYAPPSLNPYDRLADIDAPLGVDTNEGGVSAIADWNLGRATLTSVSAWRFWNWDAANDRDYTSLSIQTLQHIPSRQDQYSQEFRLASNGMNRLDYVAGLYWFAQTILGEPITQYGPVATHWLLGAPPTYPSNLLDGYGTDGDTRFHSDSWAAFGETTWHATDRLALTLGLRYTLENKQGRFDSSVYGGLATTDPALIKAKLSILRPQSYDATVNDGAPTGRFNVAYNLTQGVMAYASYAKGEKSGGINMSGLPLDAQNKPALSTAVIKPERNTTVEFGVKSDLLARHLQLNVDVYDTTVRHFQANVVDNAPGALRGYLANIEEVRVNGLEADANFLLTRYFSGYVAAAITDAKYESYQNGPCPLELIGTATSVCDLSGKPLCGTPHTVVSAGGEFRLPLHLASTAAEGFVRADLTYRTDTYGDPSDSKYTLIDGYTLVNGSLGLRVGPHWEVSLWARNLFDKGYMQNLTVQAGNSGLIVGTPSDPRTVGVGVRGSF
jgi:iron complex outermembrane receptor protein